MKKLFLLLLIVSGNALASSAQERTLASVHQTLRVEHARELMGDRYNKSIVSRFEKQKNLEKNIFKVVKMRLPKAYKAKAHKIAQTIIEESTRHSLDPYFVMAVISGESSFDPLAKGPVGEIGMMQIRPTTGKWLAEITRTKWNGEKMLRDPIQNIKFGVAYLGWLREKFQGHGQLYLAAYNMGPTSVKSALSRNVYPKDYPIHVMKRYLAFYKDIGKQRGTL